MHQDVTVTLVSLAIGTIFTLWQAWLIVPFPRIELDQVREEFRGANKNLALPDILIDSSLPRRLRRIFCLLFVNGAYAVATYFFSDIPGAMWGALVLILVEAAAINLVSTRGAKIYVIDLYQARKIRRDHY